MNRNINPKPLVFHSLLPPLIAASGVMSLTSPLTPVRAQQAAPASSTGDAGTLMRQAAALEAAGKWQQAGQLYTKAAKAFEAKQQFTEQANALEKSATMYEKFAESLAPGKAAPAANPRPAAPERDATTAGTTPPPTQGALPLPLTKSALVHPNKKGVLAVSAPNGKPIVGIKLSRHDNDIHNPSIVVSPNGTIHVAFVEQRKETPYTYSIYYRSSTDGGKSWSEAKNLSEVMPDYQIGNCRIAADGSGRVYVVWRSSFGPSGASLANQIQPHSSGEADNLVYRVLENGSWSGRAILVNNPPVDPQKQTHGTSSWFVSADPTGKVHVCWNTDPEPRHPEALIDFGGSKSHSPGIGLGEIMEVTLNGKTPTPMREVYQTPINTKVTNDNPQGWPTNENLDEINGYVDGNGQAHILAHVHRTSVTPEQSVRYALIENGKMTPAFELPGTPSDYWMYPPTLLLDAQGKRHAISMYTRGEQPHVRDYVVGSDAEPAIIRASREVSGKLEGMEACQGPDGQMVVIMQMNDTGKDTDDELYVSTSNGGKWSAPVNVTNNTGHIAFHSTATSSRSHVATESYWYPGSAAAAFDRSGHLVMTYVSKEFSIVDSSAFGVSVAGGSTATPKLLFLRF